MSRVSSKLKRRRLHRLFEMQAGVCAHCGREMLPVERRDGSAHVPALAPTIDHVVPEVAGGIDALVNLVAAHRICNERRGHQPPSQSIKHALENNLAQLRADPMYCMRDIQA